MFDLNVLRACLASVLILKTNVYDTSKAQQKKDYTYSKVIKPILKKDVFCLEKNPALLTPFMFRLTICRTPIYYIYTLHE